VVLVRLGPFGVQHDQNFVCGQSPDDLLSCRASHGLNRPRLPVPLGTERHVDGAGSDGHCSIAHMKRLLAALAGLLGLAWWRSRPKQAAPDLAPDPADALRAKLA